jgi:hypothetical protein
MIIAYWNMMGSKVLKNAWQKMGYIWFEMVGDDDNSDDDSNSNGDNNDNNDDDNVGNVNVVFDNGKGNENYDDDQSNYNNVAKEGWDYVEERGA